MVEMTGSSPVVVWYSDGGTHDVDPALIHWVREGKSGPEIVPWVRDRRAVYPHHNWYHNPYYTSISAKANDAEIVIHM